MLCIRLVSSLAEVFGSFGFECVCLFPMIFSVADPHSLYYLSLHFPSIFPPFGLAQRHSWSHCSNYHSVHKKLTMLHFIFFIFPD